MKISGKGYHPLLWASTVCLFFCHIAIGQVPTCTQLTFPAPGEMDVSVFTDLEWDASPTATGYVILAGTSLGGRDIIDNLNVGNVTAYGLDNNLPPFQDIYVAIIPYNDQGLNGSCATVSFTTRQVDPPLCTEIINPTDGDVLVSVTANITWIREFTASGYRMTVYERDPNGILIWDEVDVGNGTNAKPPDFKPRTQYFVTIIPYNEGGAAMGCQPISFTTGDGPPLPDCTQLTVPTNGSNTVATDTGLEWGAVNGVDGYTLSVGTTPRGTDIVNALDVGNTTSFTFSEELPLGTTVYVLIVPYVGNLEAETCSIDSFTTTGPDPETVNELIPRFFTPNNDGFNDTWSVSSSQDISIQNISVFNRFGKLIKQLAPDQGWDGTFNGRNLPSDSYWYSVKLTNGPSLKGYFALKR
ncbi:T9SS type B sorting domain-containing protein [Ulvibacterium sp.]|uniref:T9SS type B sorting domain-containing protein n=1 Tax=Ulvibacterium sp. TaxID=2665914 RepID=UPI002623DE09|nr:T9SS type B sorting domain-containing protein [Ulvibacterium sp.]